MRYVFRVLASNIKKSLQKSPSGVGFYTIPLVINENKFNKVVHIAVPEYLTFYKKDNLYIILDDEKEQEDIKILGNKSFPISDNEVLKIINDDYLSYIINRYYSHKLPHAINNLTPVGISILNEETDEYETDKWSGVINQIAKTYPVDFMAINPLTSDFLYPFEYKKFLSKQFVREYRSNVMLFCMTYDAKFYFKFDSSKSRQYIYYYKNGEYLPLYELLTEKLFFMECERKDKKNSAKTPFLKTFNDHGVSKELISFMIEDEGYQKLIHKAYNDLKEEIDLKKNEKRYFIPCLSSNFLLDIESKIANNIPIKESERLNYVCEKEKLLIKLSELYENDKIFYFSTEDIDISDGNITINSATKNFIENYKDELYFDKKNKIIYSVSLNDGVEKHKPILKLVDSEELKDFKDKVYKKWYDLKQLKFRKF